MKLAAKLAIGYVTTLLLVGGLAFAAIEVSSRYAAATAGDLASRLAQEMMRRINYGIYLKLDELRSLTNAPVVRETLSEAARTEGASAAIADAQREPMRRFLESSLITQYELSRGYRLFPGGRVADSAGRTVVTVGQHSSLLIPKSEQAGEVLVSQVAFDPETGMNGIPIHVAIRGRTVRRRVGTLHVVLSLTALAREIELATTQLVGSTVELMRNDGTILYATTPFRFFTRGESAEYLSEMSGTHGYVMVRDAPQPSLRAYARSSGYSSFPGLEWVLVLSQPLDAVTQQSNVVRNVMLAVSAFIFLAVLIVSFVVSRSITRPINRLRLGAFALANGELSYRVPVNRNDEIGELSQAFDDMATRLQLLYRELEDFAYIVSHDMREPLRGIRHYTDALQEDYGDSFEGEGLTYLQSLKRLSMRLDALVKSLLEYSRAGRVDLRLVEVDLNEVVAEIRDDLILFLHDRGAEVNVAQPLPKVRCDRTSVGEIFRNLVTNAVKYNDSSRPYCEIGTIQRNGTLVVYVKDNGIGIPPDSLETVFRIFKRLHGQERYGEGTGSGLTIVKRLIERHNGRIWVESDEGRGSTFFFTLAGT